MTTFNLDSLVNRGATIKAIHRGEGVRSVARNAFHDFTIPEVDPSKSITLNNVGALFAGRQNEPLTQASLLVNSPTTVRLQSLEPFNTIAWSYTYEVIEFESGVNVKRGVDTITPAANGGVVDFTIDPVNPIDPAKSLLFYRVMERQRTSYSSVQYNAQILNGTTIRVRNRSPRADTCNIQWEVLTYD